MWDEIGTLQFEFIRAEGLNPHYRFLDVGCGSFRGGVHFVNFLDAGNYCGIDINGALIDAGVERKLMPVGLDKKVPRGNLLESANFEFGRFGQRFDFALARSLFTHVP